MLKRTCVKCTNCGFIRYNTDTMVKCGRCGNKDQDKIVPSYEPKREAVALLCEAIGYTVVSPRGQKVEQAVSALLEAM